MNVTDSNNFNRHLSSYKEGFTPDPEAGLAKLHQRLGGTESVEQPAVVRRLFPKQWVAVAAAALVLIVASFLLLKGDGSTTYANDTLAPMAFSLPDGTEVLLQQGGALTYPADYNQADRQIVLEGQAYFEVNKDGDRPFLVNSGETELRVTGTAFNLRVSDSEMEVEVSEGSIELHHEGEMIPVAALQCGLAQKGEKPSLMMAEDLNRHAWRTGTLRFDSISFPVALKTISNNYGFHLSYPAGCDFPIAGTYVADDPVAVLRTIAELDGGTLEQMDDASFRFVGMGCSK